MITTLSNFFNYQVATAFGVPVSLIEVVGFITGAICVYGVAKQRLWNWPVGIMNNAAFGILFFGAGLYAETFLQFCFAVIAFYGWYKWIYGGGALKNTLPVRTATRPEIAYLSIAAVIGTVGVALLLRGATDSEVPFWDSLVLSLSLVATYGQAKKVVSSWYVWIVVDLVSIPLYVSRDLYLTAILYVGFLALCLLGLANWRKALREQNTVTTTDVPPAQPQAEALTA